MAGTEPKTETKPNPSATLKKALIDFDASARASGAGYRSHPNAAALFAQIILIVRDRPPGPFVTRPAIMQDQFSFHFIPGDNFGPQGNKHGLGVVCIIRQM